MYRAAIGSKPPCLSRQRMRCLIHARTECERGILTPVFQGAVFQRETRTPSSGRRDVALPDNASNRRDRCTERQALGWIDIELPTEKSYGKSLLQEKTIA